MNATPAPPPLTPGGKILRFATVGVIAGGTAVAFAFTGGWLTPHRLTPAKFVNNFEQATGKHEGFRRNHGKGVIVGGTFESNGSGAKWSKAAVFAAGTRTPVDGRFSLPGPMPFAADTAGGVRALALRFTLPTGEEWRTAMINLPVFIVKDPQSFYDQMIASAPDPQTHQPDPAKMGAFLKAHPETIAAFGIIKKQPPTNGYLDAKYNALNAFILTAADGSRTPVRWSFVPLTPPNPSDATSQPAGPPADPNFLFDRIISDIHAAPVKFELVLTIGQPGDPINDATKMWPDDREKVDVGTLTLSTIESEETSPAGTLNFDPTVLPDGIAVSDDPLLPARSAAYANSFTRRQAEPMHTAIPSSEVHK